METRVITAHVPLELSHQVDRLAEHLERSKGWIVKQALKDWVTEEEKHLQTLEALRDVDDGKVVSHEEVERWFASLNS